MKVRHFTLPFALLPNRWDGVAFLLLFGLLALFAGALQDMQAPLAVTLKTPISLEPEALPGYALRTVLRLLAAILISLVFTFVYATLAAKSRRLETILIPLLDVLQSVPVLGFISFSVVFLIRLFPGSTLGAECASIFAIFSSQAWNMTFSFYQSLRTLPRDLVEVSHAFRFSAWQRFFRLELPFAMPGLVWNMMVSMSGGWFFVVACEAITVGHTTFTLPGIGSYVAQAIMERNLGAVGWAVLAMFLVILIYDQLLFRPLVTWSERFRADPSPQPAMQHWIARLFKHTQLLRRLFLPVGRMLYSALTRLRIPRMPRLHRLLRRRRHMPEWLSEALWYLLLAVATVLGGWKLMTYITQTLNAEDVREALLFGFYTLLRVSVLILLASLLWVPIGVWVGLRPRATALVQPLAQFLAAFPANLLFPVAVMAIVRFDLSPDIWLSPLIILGTQWYLLFNVIAGTTALPRDLREAAASFHIRGWQWWKTVALPGIFPYYVTGAITASGASWNASILAEMASWGDTTLAAKGLGAYIAKATIAADYPRIVLGISVMALFVILINRLLWDRLYSIAERRLRLD